MFNMMTLTPRTIQRCSACREIGHNRRTCPRARETLSLGTVHQEWLSDVVPKLGIKVEKPPHMCIICMESVNKLENNVMTLPCGHTYHTTCGIKWLQDHNTCPTCRNECGEKRKNIPLLTPDVAMDLVQYRIMGGGPEFQTIMNEITMVMIKPWLTNQFKCLLDNRDPDEWELSGVLSTESIELINNSFYYDNEARAIHQYLEDESLKQIWDDLNLAMHPTSGTTYGKSKQQNWLFELLYTNAYKNMYNIISDAYKFQAAGESIPGDESTWPRVNNEDVHSAEVQGAEVQGAEVQGTEVQGGEVRINLQTEQIIDDEDLEVLIEELLPQREEGEIDEDLEILERELAREIDELQEAQEHTRMHSLNDNRTGRSEVQSPLGLLLGFDEAHHVTHRTSARRRQSHRRRLLQEEE